MSRRVFGALERRKGWLAALTAGLVVFAQIAIAAQACMLAERSFALQQAMSEAGCDGIPVDSTECAARCGAQAQAAVPDHSVHADQVAVANFFAPFALTAIREAPRLVPRQSPGPAGPPLRVLYCSYQL